MKNTELRKKMQNKNCTRTNYLKHEIHFAHGKHCLRLPKKRCIEIRAL